MLLPVDVDSCLFSHSAKLVHKQHSVISATLWLQWGFQDMEEVLYQLPVISNVPDELEGLGLDHKSHYLSRIHFQGVSQDLVLQKLETNHLVDKLHGVWIVDRNDLLELAHLREHLRVLGLSLIQIRIVINTKEK